MGYEGFPELQDALEDVVRIRLTTLQRYEMAFDKMTNKDVLSKVISADISTLKGTLELVDQEAFDKAVASLLTAKKYMFWE